MNWRSRGLGTKVIHAGEPEPRLHGAISIPVFQTAIFETTEDVGYHDIRYIRLNNTPNHTALQDKLASLENGEAALVAASGMAAISTTLLTILSSGDHLLAQGTLYGGTYSLITKHLPLLGISHTFLTAQEPESWAKLLRPTTRAVYVETMTNPLLQVEDLEAVVRFSREHGLISVIDNTFGSPVNFRPPEHGFDLSLHSCTKYLNGHSDLVAGAVIGRASLVERIKKRLDHLGGSLDPHACVLLHRGIKTLALRVEYQNHSALTLAQFLAAHPAVLQVNYPGLAQHPQHTRSRRLFDGFGGVLSFEHANSLIGCMRFLERLQIPLRAPSLGGVESLVTRPASTSHAGLSPEERRSLGIGDSLIRVSVGIETTGDLLEDFDHALAYSMMEC